MHPTKRAPAPVVRPLPVRRLPSAREEAVALTVLQPAEQYAALLRWCDRVAAGRRPTPHEVVRALLLRLLADPGLGADLAADLREGIAGQDLVDYVCW